MNANETYWIGKDHNVCEDYAIAEANDVMSYAIVSDGCSASKDVDFGARALAMSAKKYLRLGEVTDFTPEEFGESVIQNAAKVVDIFPYLSFECLDATLLVAWVQNKNLTVYMYGDGLLVHRMKDGINTTHIHLTSNAPDYLSYHLNPLRRQQYDELKDNKKEISVEMTPYHPTPVISKPFEPYVYGCSVEEGDVISVISDGINSFRRSDYTPIPWQELVDEFTAYKNFEGEFVLRRVSAFKRKCLKDGITHSDDISVASIIV